MQHERGHTWPFTVMAPVKEFGNIPGFKDCSPEEIRYQYYDALSKNTLFEFVSIEYSAYYDYALLVKKEDWYSTDLSYFGAL